LIKIEKKQTPIKMIDLSIDLEYSILPTTCPTTEDEKPTATSKIVIKIP